MISNRIKYVGVNDKEKTLFEGLWPLPYGVSYNSYIIKDEKIALIDTVESGNEAEYLSKIREEIGESPIDYLIINHMEPDHSSENIIRTWWWLPTRKQFLCSKVIRTDTTAKSWSSRKEMNYH